MSRIANQIEQESELQETEFDDKYFQVNVINSHQLHHRQGFGDLGMLEEMPKSEMTRLGEYQEDEEIKALKRNIESEKASKELQEKYMAQDQLLYYLSDRDVEVQPRLNISELIQEDLLKQIHDHMRHIGVDKTYELIGMKYFLPFLYKEVSNYINSCVIRHSRSSKSVNAFLEETYVPS